MGSFPETYDDPAKVRHQGRATRHCTSTAAPAAPVFVTTYSSVDFWAQNNVLSQTLVISTELIRLV